MSKWKFLFKVFLLDKDNKNPETRVFRDFGKNYFKGRTQLLLCPRAVVVNCLAA